MVSIQGSCLKLLRVACAFRQYLSSPSLSLPVLVRLLPQSDLGLNLYLYLFHCAYIFNSLRICTQFLYYVPACSILEGYVHNFYILTLFDWCVAYAYIFNSHGIYAQVLYCIGSVPAYSILVGCVHNFCIVQDLCLYIQFSQDMCMNSVFFLSNLLQVSCLHVQFLQDMCTNSILLDYFLDERSTENSRGLAGEYNSTKKCFGDDSNLP